MKFQSGCWWAIWATKCPVPQPISSARGLSLAKISFQAGMAASDSASIKQGEVIGISVTHSPLECQIVTIYHTSRQLFTAFCSQPQKCCHIVDRAAISGAFALVYQALSLQLCKNPALSLLLWGEGAPKGRMGGLGLVA